MDALACLNVPFQVKIDICSKICRKDTVHDQIFHFTVIEI